MRANPCPVEVILRDAELRSHGAASRKYREVCSSPNHSWGLAMRRIPLLFVLASSFFHLAAATFQFTLDTPIQCSNLTVNVVGGTPPYELILVPIGHVTPEIRTIVGEEHSFTIGLRL